MRYLFQVVCFWLLLPAVALGQEARPAAAPPAAAAPAADPQGPELIRMTVTPAGFPGGALRHRLLPEYLDRTPGNAAPIYYRVILSKSHIDRDNKTKFYENYQRYLDLPTGELPLAEVRDLLSIYGSLDDLDAAARREHCQWELRIQDLKGTDVIMVILDELQQARDLARVLTLRCRLELAEGRLADALRSMQTGFQLAQDMGKTPTLINSLVGMAICGMITQDVRRYIEHQDSTNLYWALTALPRPLIDMRQSLEQERSMALQMFPILREADKSHTPEEWRALMHDTLKTLNQVSKFENFAPGKIDSHTDLAAAAILLHGYPLAKRWLIGQGRDAEEVEAMPTAQVVALYMAESYHYLWGEMFKNMYLPYPQSLERIKLADELLTSDEVAKDKPGKEILPIARMLLPAVSAVAVAQARTDRYICELRTIEALRLYAFEHEGRWPKSLDDITAVPVPRNPVDDKPFMYRVEGETAILEIEAMPGQPRTGRRYEVTVRK